MDPAATKQKQREWLVTVLDALGEPTRMSIVEKVYDSGEVACSELDEMLGLEKSTISYHMKILNAAGLVSTRRDGRFFHYGPTGLLNDALPFLRALAVCSPEAPPVSPT